MKLFAIFGDPVAHSISPTLHNYTFEKLGFDACYTKVHLKEAKLLRQRFFDLGLQGANITVPHKEAAFAFADEVVGIAKEIGAVNTWYREGDTIYGYNTDAPGFYESIKEFRYRSVLILGAGGTAKAIALYLKKQGFAPVVLNRSQKRLSFFQERGIETWEWQTFTPRPFDLVINTTSAGLEDEALPAPKELLDPLLKNANYCVDVIYNRSTPFLRLARSYGAVTKDGTDMLLYQAILAFAIFTKKRYTIEAIETTMRQSLQLL